MISAVIGVLVLFATQRAFPELNERFKSFSSIGYLLLAGAFAVSTFNGIFFYAEPGFKYHFRTITGQEKMVSDTGYNTYLFGRVNAWKNAMSVQATRGGEGRVTAETEAYSSMSANLPSQSLVFLDQVDADVTATARFELPSDEDGFLKMARLYRTPENLLRTELIPAFQKTLGATAALMSAEDYFRAARPSLTTNSNAKWKTAFISCAVSKKWCVYKSPIWAVRMRPLEPINRIMVIW